MSKETPYERAVAMVRARASVSVQNLKTTLNISEATAKSFLRVMREEGLVSAPIGTLGRHRVLSYQPPAEGAVPALNIENPEMSVLYGEDMPIDDILDAGQQERLRKIVDFIIQEEDRCAIIREGITAAYQTAKTLGFMREAIKPVVKAIRKNAVAELKQTMDTVDLYLHAVGEVIDDMPSRTPSVFGGGGNGTQH